MQYALVISSEYPILYSVLDTISHDCGAGAGHETYSVARKWDLPRAEAALSSLTEDERQQFAIGEYEEMLSIAARSEELSYVNSMLESFFDGE